MPVFSSVKEDGRSSQPESIVLRSQCMLNSAWHRFRIHKCHLSHVAETEDSEGRWEWVVAHQLKAQDYPTIKA